MSPTSGVHYIPALNTQLFVMQAEGHFFKMFKYSAEEISYLPIRNNLNCLLPVYIGFRDAGTEGRVGLSPLP